MSSEPLAHWAARAIHILTTEAPRSAARVAQRLGSATIDVRFGDDCDPDRDIALRAPNGRLELARPSQNPSVLLAASEPAIRRLLAGQTDLLIELRTGELDGWATPEGLELAADVGALLLDGLARTRSGERLLHDFARYESVTA